MEEKQILSLAANALNSKKAVDITAVRISDLTVLTDYFLIASGTSTTHVRALAEEVEDKLSAAGVDPYRVEGRATGWILLDYGSVLVHVFTDTARKTYDLERLWADGEKCDLSDILDDVTEE